MRDGWLETTNQPSRLLKAQPEHMKAQPEHMSQLGEHLTWTIAKALSARNDHVVRKKAQNRNKAVSVGASGFACNPNDEEQCRFVDLRDTMVWTFELVAWPQSDETLIRSFFWYPAAMEYAKATTQTLGNQYLPPDLCLCRCRVWVKLGYTKLRQWPLSLQPAGAQADISAPISSKWNASGGILTTKFRSSWWAICLDTKSQHRSHVSSHVRNESDFF